VAWLVAALLLVAGRPTSGVVPWLAGFLVLTIAGERLELARLGRLSGPKRTAFVLVAAVFCGGVVATLVVPDAGVRLAGVGLLGLAAWLARNDLARRTVRMPGVTRFIALCLLIGYGWLAVAGGSWLAFGSAIVGRPYDAMPPCSLPRVRHVDGLRPRARDPVRRSSASRSRTGRGSIATSSCSTRAC